MLMKIFFIFFYFSIAELNKNFTFATLLRVRAIEGMRAVSSVGSEHLVYTQRVGGSNPSPPTGIKNSSK